MASRWNLWVWLVCGVVRRYIDFLIISLIPTPLVLALFCSSIPTSVHLKKNFFHSCSYSFANTAVACYPILVLGSLNRGCISILCNIPPDP